MNFINQLADKTAWAARDHNEGVRCDVTNCFYHDQHGKCSADKIKVGPTYAASSADTACATFKQKQ